MAANFPVPTAMQTEVRMTYEEKEEIWIKVFPVLDPLIEPHFGNSVSSYGIREGKDGLPEIIVKGTISLPAEIVGVRVIVEN